jgi:hypothetical protein
VETLLGQQGLGPFDKAGEAKASFGERPMDLRKGQFGQAVCPNKVPHDFAERGSREGDHLGKVPGLRGNIDLQHLYSLEEDGEAAGRPGSHS